MMTLLKRLQNVAADNKTLKADLQTKEKRILKLEMDKQRLWDENRISRKGGNLASEGIGQLSFREQESEERPRKKRTDVINSATPQIELTQTKSADYHGVAASDSKSGGALLREESQGSDEEAEMTMQQELTMLGGENLGGTFTENNEMFGGRGMSGEEYFETHPNDQSYEIDNTNRDLVSPGNVPIEMMSPDVSMMHDEIKPKKRS